MIYLFILLTRFLLLRRDQPAGGLRETCYKTYVTMTV